MLGRIRGIAAGVAGVAQARATALTAVQDDEAEVESLLQRVSDALLAEYRREAIGQLKELLADNPKVKTLMITTHCCDL
jgi:hypothetical protein